MQQIFYKLDFLNLVYPNRKFTFVWVDNYKGEGSCQGLSMIQAKSHLQCPFIFNSCDTIVNDCIGLILQDFDYFIFFGIQLFFPPRTSHLQQSLLFDLLA